MSQTAPRVLFLHGGPGFQAVLERRCYAAHPSVLWWDQPRLTPGTPAPFDALVRAAAAQLVELATPPGTPVAILASSFGVFLADKLLRRMPDRIASLTISGGILDLWTPFIRLGRHLGRAQGDAALVGAADEADRLRSPKAFWALIDRIAHTPYFFDAYWGPAATAQRMAMRALAAQGLLFDMPTFSAVVADLLAARRRVRGFPAGPPVRVLIGRHDPIADPLDAAAWKQAFVGASVEVVDTGHFPHLELPPSAWLPD